ncbi:flagellar motor switch protein FliM [Pseudoflavonifractor sp. 60]|uniref:flagellar motor switch protein FliM n=1 Tax=Pseudoflavonifractor sp. 60 TaxID=2304576 RepID=UPI001367F015|nr:FliM/FliN family flagellar motor switch protein [Pseudoflavonifractor sp. 60]MCI8914292.1 flagellar motor switch protein FliM [Lawsonibacter sp.]NBI67892.1 flagellar motor switch protein FliM [Pseudoflavonifractor sp. 60]
MAEVLSQSQIDALLNAARSGELDVDKPAEKSAEQKYRKYDFYSPRKFTKDRLKMLNSIFESYARVINSRINALLHATCEIEVDSVEEQRYYEFSNALTESDVVALAKIDLEKLQGDDPILVHLDTPVVLSMLDRLMGGEGDPDPTLVNDYNMTDLELDMYEDLIKDLVPIMGSSWENYITIRFEYTRTEVNPTLVQLIGYDETVVIVGLNIKFPNCTGRISLCLPGEMLTNVFSEISKNTTRRTTGEDKSEEIFDTLRESELEIVAELARTRILLSDLYHLNVGDVVDIKRPKDSPVFLNIGGRRWFDGRMGTSNKQVAVKIGETYIKM